MFQAKWLALASGLLLAANGGIAEQGASVALAAAEPGGKGDGSSAQSLDADQLADTLIEARREGQVLDVLARRHPALDLGQAYRIQNAMLRRKLAAGERRTGWKIARSRANLLDPEQPPVPAFGHVMASDVLPDGHVFPSKAFGGMVMAEVEIALWLGKDLPGPEVGREELLEAISAVGGAIEVLANRVGIDPIKLPHAVADNMFQAGVLFTRQRKPLAEVDFSREAAAASIDGQAHSDGRAADLMGEGPLAAALWLANELPKHGHQLEAGDFIITGSILIPPLLRPGETATAHYSSFGELSIAREGYPQGYRMVHDWPQRPNRFILGQVSGLGVNSSGEVLAFHRADRFWTGGESYDSPIARPTILKISGATGERLGELGAGQFFMPHGLSVDHEDNIWVTDVALHQVFKLSPEGELLMALGERGEAGNDARRFNMPTDAAVGGNGDIYVSDGYGNSRIAKFSPDGEFLFDWGTEGQAPGEFNVPHSIVLDAEQRVYVADRGNKRVQVFDQDGTYLTEWQSDALGRPWGLSLGPNNLIYAVDGGNLSQEAERGHVVQMNLQGEILAKWGGHGKGEGQFMSAHDLALDAEGSVYVGDVFFGMRIQKFIPQATTP